MHIVVYASSQTTRIIVGMELLPDPLEFETQIPMATAPLAIEQHCAQVRAIDVTEIRILIPFAGPCPYAPLLNPEPNADIDLSS